MATLQVDVLMQQALQNRPDLLADLGRLRAAEAGIVQARADLRPTLGIDANVQGNIGQIGVDSGPYQGIRQPQAGVFLRLDWPLYQGGLRQNRIRLAQSLRDAAEDTLEQGSDHAMRQVALAYDQLDTGLSQYEAALALQSASETAFNAANDAYAHGVGTFTDAQAALATLTTARSSLARAHAQSLINAAALAFATGALTSGSATNLDAIDPMARRGEAAP
jgi:outer membrane protein TolC